MIGLFALIVAAMLLIVIVSACTSAMIYVASSAAGVALRVLWCSIRTYRQRQAWNTTPRPDDHAGLPPLSSLDVDDYLAVRSTLVRRGTGTPQTIGLH